MAREDVDALVVSGSEYTGFDGAVTYMSGFNIVHRYAYVLVPLEGDPAIVFPSEARYVGFHDAAWVDEKVFVDRPGDWLRERCAGASRVGVYGLDYVMNVRDYRALAEGDFEIVPFDEAFDRDPCGQERGGDGVRSGGGEHQRGRASGRCCAPTSRGRRRPRSWRRRPHASSSSAPGGTR